MGRKLIPLALALIFLCASTAKAKTAPVQVAGCVANAAATCTWANFSGKSASVGDELFYFAYKSSVTAPTAPGSTTNVSTASANSSSFRSGCAVLTTTTPAAITATGATEIFVAIVHGTAATTTANCLSAGIGLHVTGSGSASTTYTFTGGTLTVTDGTSLVLGAVGSSAAPCTPASLTKLTANSSTDIFDTDTNGGVSTFTTTTCTGTSGNSKTNTVEFIASNCNVAINGSWTREQYGWNSASGALTVTLGCALTNPSTLVVAIIRNSNAVATPTATGQTFADCGAGNATLTFAAVASNFQVFCAKNTNTTSALAITMANAAGDFSVMSVLEIGGADTTTPVRSTSLTSGGNTGVGGGQNMTTTNTGSSNTDLVLGFGYGNAGTITVGTGFTGGLTPNQTGDNTEYKVASGNIAATWSDNTNSESYAAQGVALKLPAAAATVHAIPLLGGL